MTTRADLCRNVIAIAVTTAVTSGVPGNAAAHCDTLDGPVIQDARKALNSGDVTPVLKWVKERDEKAVRAAYIRALRARGKTNAEAAETVFFSTIVKIHRAGEGASFTGLKPAGSVEPAVAEADKALASGSSADLIKLLSDAVAAGIRERHKRAVATYEHKDDSVAAGREFVEAYVDYTHYVERVHADATGGGAHAHQDRDVTSAKHKHGH